MNSHTLYKFDGSYDWNLINPPVFQQMVAPAEKSARLGQFGTDLPIGIPAGPLLNSDFILAALNMGSRINTYKTVRTVYRNCLPFPNCVFLKPGTLAKPSANALSEPEFYGASLQNPTLATMTNSFGMPSRTPLSWKPDVEKSIRYTDEVRGAALIVSVVGTPEDGAVDAKTQLAKDYAKCAAEAKDAGAKIIELNFSCPNVRADLGAIYLDHNFVGQIVKQTRHEIGNDSVLLIKVGRDESICNMEKVVKSALRNGVNGFVGINTISMNVLNSAGLPALPGRKNGISGVCGNGIRDYAMEWLEQIGSISIHLNQGYIIGSCGGVTKPQDFQDRLDNGADFVLSATGAMMNNQLFAQYHNLANGH